MGEKKRRLAVQQQHPQAANLANHSGGALAPEGKAQQLLQAGRQAHRAGQLIEAVNAYQAALKLAPGLVDALHFQGLAMLQLGQGALGLALLRQSITQAPDNAMFHFNLGSALRGSDPEAALSALRQAAMLAPEDHDFAIVLSELLLQQKQLQEAIRELERAHALRPQRWETLQGLVELYYRNNQHTLARARYEQTIALRPQLADSCRVGFAAPASRPEQTVPLRLADFPGTVLQDEHALQEFAAARDLRIIDNFLEDPVAWREQALALPFHAQRYAGQNYPGVQTLGQECQPIMERIAAALGRNIKFISPDNGSYRISYADDVARTDIHVDNESGDQFAFYAGVLYLNAPEQCQGGTTFWRHLPSGWERRPPEPEVRAAYPSFREFQKRWLPNTKVQKFNELQEKRDAWQALLEVPMRHNRLIVYRGHYFHSISKVFGSTPEDGRLVQLFFFEAAD
jgi:tetratricopeptide (TPR) repeat protein